MNSVPQYVLDACERMTREDKEGCTYHPLHEGSRGWRARKYNRAGLCLASLPI